MQSSALGKLHLRTFPLDMSHQVGLVSHAGLRYEELGFAVAVRYDQSCYFLVHGILSRNFDSTSACPQMH
jgi:hypothetical protein